ncbi:MAG: methyltransferase domain-containing protein [Actinomycetota bacterium]|nr:methyltransferase domain-containing protein [Actinomycetota bacterium]
MSVERTFVPHPVEWTPEKSSRWWNVTSERHQDRYFSLRYGRALVGLVQLFGVRLGGSRVLDFGCGSGYLLDALLARGIPCSGADFSEDAVAVVRKRLEGNRLFQGVQLVQEMPTSLKDESYDAVFFIETVEHLLDGDLESTLRELRRIIRPGGALIVTTPNDEQLAQAESICPDCGCIFHPVQHVRSWDKDSLSEKMREFGLSTVTCRPLYLQRTALQTLVVSAVARGLRKRLPNLMFIGRKHS